jgi:hypothetical protein
MRSALLPFVVAYSRLILYSFSFQQAFVRGITANDKPVLLKCMDAAKAVVEVMINGLAPTGLMRFSPDGWFLMASFASAFLFKLLRPQLRFLVSQEQETEILELVGRLIQTLGSNEIAIDDRHTPKVYARFLAGLLSKHRREGLSESQPPRGGLPAHPNGHVPQQQQQQQDAQAQPMYADARMHNAYQHSQQQVQQSQLQPQQNAVYAGTQPPPSLLMNGQPFLSTPELTSDYSEESLASLAALRNPAWWDGMMLPGFSWPTSPTVGMSNLNFPPPMQQNSMGPHPMTLPAYP